MSIQIKVDAVTKEPRIWQGKTQWGVKTPDGWITLYREAKPAKGEVIDVNISERKGNNGQSYKDAFPVMPPLAPAEPTPTPEPVKVKKIPTWDEWRAFIKAAHSLALVLEPDERSSTTDGSQGMCLIDRAPARVGFINRVMDHFASGKILVPTEDDDEATQAEQDSALEGFPW